MNESINQSRQHEGEFLPSHDCPEAEKVRAETRAPIGIKGAMDGDPANDTRMLSLLASC